MSENNGDIPSQNYKFEDNPVLNLPEPTFTRQEIKELQKGNPELETSEFKVSDPIKPKEPKPEPEPYDVLTDEQFKITEKEAKQAGLEVPASDKKGFFSSLREKFGKKSETPQYVDTTTPGFVNDETAKIEWTQEQKAKQVSSEQKAAKKEENIAAVTGNGEFDKTKLDSIKPVEKPKPTVGELRNTQDLKPTKTYTEEEATQAVKDFYYSDADTQEKKDTSSTTQSVSSEEDFINQSRENMPKENREQLDAFLDAVINTPIPESNKLSKEAWLTTLPPQIVLSIEKLDDLLDEIDHEPLVSQDPKDKEELQSFTKSVVTRSEVNSKLFKVGIWVAEGTPDEERRKIVDSSYPYPGDSELVVVFGVRDNGNPKSETFSYVLTESGWFEKKRNTNGEFDYSPTDNVEVFDILQSVPTQRAKAA